MVAQNVLVTEVAFWEMFPGGWDTPGRPFLAQCRSELSTPQLGNSQLTPFIYVLTHHDLNRGARRQIENITKGQAREILAMK